MHRDGPPESLLQPHEESKIISSMTLMKYHYICSIHPSQPIISPIPSVGLKTINCSFSRPEHGASIEISFNFDFPALDCGWYFPQESAMVMGNGWTR
jgi:hypothetical protein